MIAVLSILSVPTPKQPKISAQILIEINFIVDFTEITSIIRLNNVIARNFIPFFVLLEHKSQENSSLFPY